MENVRVRFAPSPTGALHIGGVRTALYNYLFARKHGGSFILRIEDTDQNRYVPGAEAYIVESLQWLNLIPDEGPGFDGNYGPYRQSERKEIYQQYARQLVDSGHAYYAFDTPEALNERREAEKARGNDNWKYDSTTRMDMENSLTLPEAEVRQRLDGGDPYVIRLKVPPGEVITFQDLIREEVSFRSEELDDKVILKGDGMPTYHLANVVDDYLMQVSHVIRGEEWLPSTAHHVLLYRFLGWIASMPQFAHLPLIFKPSGQGKLSKRDSRKLGIPVFPISWNGETDEDSFRGFREFGFDPRAVINFLAFLGWNPGTEQEIFSLEELCEAFSIENISKSGARFNYDKAKWYNQQYIMATPDQELARAVRPWIAAHGHHPDDHFLETFCGLMKERVECYPDFWDQAYYFFEDIRDFDEKTIRKKWNPDRRPLFEELRDRLQATDTVVWADHEAVKEVVVAFMNDRQLKFGDVLPILRVGLSGTMQGPAVFEMMTLLGRETVVSRLTRAYDIFDGHHQKD